MWQVLCLHDIRNIYPTSVYGAIIDIMDSVYVLEAS
jgi:hypothetical protein